MSDDDPTAYDGDPGGPARLDSILPIDTQRPGGSRKRRRRGRNLPGCLAVLVALAVVLGGVYVVATHGVSAIKDHLAGPDDYPGPGTGKVTVQVRAGETAADIGNDLKSDGVVASVEAFTDAAKADSKSSGIQVGSYRLKKQMKAADALGVLIDPKNLIGKTVTIPEGFRLDQIVAAVVKATRFTQPQLTALLAHPAQIGLPAEAKGNPEGYLFPATYTVTPGETARTLLSQMVSKTVSEEKTLDVATKGRALGLTPHQVIVVASILEYEADNDADYAKVARVIYNRLKIGMLLQLDSTVSYISDRSGDIYTTPAERQSDSPYNTYKSAGLPPGPIGSAGEAAIRAALDPTPGNWLYFVPDYAHHTTHFTASYADHLRYVALLQEYCRTHTRC